MNIQFEHLTGLTDSHLSCFLVGQREFQINTLIHSDLQALIDDAKKNGFEFYIASGFRDYHRQAVIWNNKFTGLRPILDANSQALEYETLSDMEKVHAIMRWSALPGASRHHWGTDLDVYAGNCLPTDTSIQLEPWEYQTGHQADFSQWLQQALPKFNFYLPYQEDRGGVAIEPWHISHQTSQYFMTQLTPKTLLAVWQQFPFSGHAVVSKSIDELYNQYINVANFS